MRFDNRAAMAATASRLSKVWPEGTRWSIRFPSPLPTTASTMIPRHRTDDSQTQNEGQEKGLGGAQGASGLDCEVPAVMDGTQHHQGEDASQSGPERFGPQQRAHRESGQGESEDDEGCDRGALLLFDPCGDLSGRFLTELDVHRQPFDADG